MEKAKVVNILKHLAFKGAINNLVSISSKEFGSEMGISQQSASNWILKLVNEGYIERQLGARRQNIKLSEKGLGVLRSEMMDYKCLFETSGKILMNGVVTSGFGEGGYYITQKGYTRQFEKELDIFPYEGTLNLKLGPKEMESLELLKKNEGIQIKGFTTGSRTFGDVKCFPALINNMKCAVVIPKRSHYKDVVEIISRVHLRRTLSLKDNEEVQLCVMLEK